jgi:hypothetical protein
MLRTLLILLIAELSLVRVNASPFSNLDFELANPIEIFNDPASAQTGSGFAPVSDLLPAWRLASGESFGSRTDWGSSMGYNLPFFDFTGPPYLSLIGPREPPTGGAIG